MSNTLTRVKKVTAEVLKTDPAKIKDTAHFVRDLGAESIQSIELVAAFEEEFEIEMDEAAALAVSTIDGAVKFIDQVLAQEKGK